MLSNKKLKVRVCPYVLVVSVCRRLIGSPNHPKQKEEHKHATCVIPANQFAWMSRCVRFVLKQCQREARPIHLFIVIYCF